MTYLVDTNVLSQLRRRSKVNDRAQAWFGRVAPAQLHISSMTVFEIAHGIGQLARRDADAARLLRTWLNASVLTAFDGRILPFDAAVAQQCAALHIGRTRLDRDRLIAATAIVQKLVVLTRNVRDFRGLGVRTENPFE